METKEKYSQKILDLAKKPKHRGAYFIEDASEKGMALLEAKCNDIKLYWLVHPRIHQIYSTRFFAYGGTLSLAIGESLCTLAEEKELLTFLDSTSASTIASFLDTPENPFPLEENKIELIQNLLTELSQKYETAQSIALASEKAAQKKEALKTLDTSSLSEQDKQWVNLPIEEKKEKIEAVIDAEIRPGLAMDSGDITILDIKDHYQLIVRWEGSCGSCSSSAGATLSFVEDKLRKQVFASLEVISETPFM